MGQIVVRQEVGQPPLMGRRTVGFGGSRLPTAGGGGVCLGPPRKGFSPWVRQRFPTDMQEAPPALVPLIKVENMRLRDAFNHFGMVKSSGLWVWDGPGVNIN